MDDFTGTQSNQSVDEIAVATSFSSSIWLLLGTVSVLSIVIPVSIVALITSGKSGAPESMHSNYVDSGVGQHECDQSDERTDAIPANRVDMPEDVSAGDTKDPRSSLENQASNETPVDVSQKLAKVDGKPGDGLLDIDFFEGKAVGRDVGGQASQDAVDTAELTQNQDGDSYPETVPDGTGSLSKPLPLEQSDDEVARDLDDTNRSANASDRKQLGQDTPPIGSVDRDLTTDVNDPNQTPVTRKDSGNLRTKEPLVSKVDYGALKSNVEHLESLLGSQLLDQEKFDDALHYILQNESSLSEESVRLRQLYIAVSEGKHEGKALESRLRYATTLKNRILAKQESRARDQEDLAELIDEAREALLDRKKDIARDITEKIYQIDPGNADAYAIRQKLFLPDFIIQVNNGATSYQDRVEAIKNIFADISGSEIDLECEKKRRYETVKDRNGGFARDQDGLIITKTIYENKISDIKIKGNHYIRSLDPLNFLKREEISRVSVHSNSLESLEGLREMSLRSLDLQGCDRLSNIEVLGTIDFSDAHLHLSDTGVADLKPLADKDIDWLFIHRCRKLVSLEGLESMPLTHLSMQDCFSITSLTSLKGTNLKSLDMRGCKNVKSLKGIEDLPLEDLYVRGSGVEGAEIDRIRALKPDLKVTMGR